MQAELDKDEVDGFTIFKVASPRVETVDQSEASPDRAEAGPTNEMDSSPPAASPLRGLESSSKERIREAPQYQYLPVRNVVVSNYGLSAHHEFQTKQKLDSDSSPTLPVLSFEEIISSSTSEMDMTPEAIARSGNAATSTYAGSSIQYAPQVNTAGIHGVVAHFESGGYEKPSGHAASYVNRSQSYISQTPGLEELGYLTEETWDFNDMSIPDDLYDTMMNAGPAEQDTLKR